MLISQAADIGEEYYFSFLLDRANRTYLAMCSAEGGMEIEQLAVEKPEALARVPVDAVAGVDDAKAREIADEGQPARGDPRPGAPTVHRQAVGRLHAARRPRWSRSTRWCGRRTAGSSRSTAR